MFILKKITREGADTRNAQFFNKFCTIEHLCIGDGGEPIF